MADGEIKLAVELEPQNVRQTTQQLQREIQDIFKQQGGKQQSSAVTALSAQMKDTYSQAQALASKLDELATKQIPTQEYIEIQNQIEKATQEFDKLLERQEKFQRQGVTKGKAWDELQYQMEEVSNTIHYAEGELQDLVNTGKAFTLGSDTAQFATMQQQLSGVNDKLTQQVIKYQELNAKENQRISRLTQTQEKLVKVKNAIENIRKTAAGATKSIQKGLSGTNFSLGKLLKKVLVYGLGIRSLYVLFNKMRQAISEGFKNFANENTKFKTQLDSLKGSILTLKNSFATAFAPIATLVIPYIQKLIDWIVKLLDYVGQFMATLAGQKTYTKAVRQTADAFKDASKAAKGYLSPIDTINKYQSSSDASGAGPMFETAPVQSNIANLVDNIRSMWKNADFSDLGGSLGEKLKNALSNIDWNGIQEKARQVASSITSFIKGFVETDGLGEKIGEALANALNTAFAFLKEFVQTMPWGEIGTFLADAFSGFIETLDAESIGETLSGFVDGVIEMLTTFFQDADWETLGQKIGDFFSAIEWGEIIWDFTKLVGSVVSAIAEAFLGWAETEPITAAIAAMLGIAILAVKIAPAVLSVIPVITGLGEVIALVAGGAATLHEALTLVFGAVSTTIAGVVAIIGGAVLAFTNFISMLKNGFSWVKEILMVIGIALAAVGAVILGAPAAVAAVVAGIIAAIATAVVLIKEHWEEIVSFIKKDWEDFKTKFVQDLKDFVNAIIGFINGGIQAIVNVINGLIELLNKIQIDIPEWVPGLGGKHIGFNFSPVTAPQIPKLASGQVVPPRIGEYLAILGDNNKETEVVSPLSTIKQALREELGNNGGNNKPIVVKLYLSGKQVLEEVVDAAKTQQLANGTNAFEI